MSKTSKNIRIIRLLSGRELLISTKRARSHIRRIELNGCHEGTLSTTGWPKYVNGSDINNIKINNSNLGKTNEFNIKQNALTSFISKYNNIMVLAGAGSSIAKGLTKSQDKYNKHSYGIYTYRIAKEIDNNLNNDLHKFYSLIDIANISTFYKNEKLKKQNDLIKKSHIRCNRKKTLIFSNFNLFLSMMNSFNYFLCNGLIKQPSFLAKKFTLTVKEINKLNKRKRQHHKNFLASEIKSGLVVYWLAHKINEEPDNINKELGYNKYYDLIELAERFNFENIRNKNKKETFNTVFSNFEDLSSEMNEFLNFIKLSNNKFDSKKYKATIRKVHYLIRKYCSLKLNDMYFDHFNFIHKLQGLNNNNDRLKIYSTNYDTLFEQAADENNSIIIDGFNYSAKRSFKNDAMKIDFVNRKNYSNQLDNSNVNAHRNVVKIFQLHGSTNWYRTNKGVFKTTTNIANNKIKNNEGKICMIFPSSKKYQQTYEDPYFDLFFNFQRDLHRKNTLLIVVGFSFSDKHIKRMVQDAMISNKSLSMIFVSHGGIKADKVNDDLCIQNSNLKGFFNSSLLSRELFFKGDLSSFTDALDLDAIHNK